MSRKLILVRNGDDCPVNWGDIPRKNNCVLVTRRGVAFAFRSKQDIHRWPLRALRRLGRVDSKYKGIWFRPVDQEVRALAEKLSFSLNNISKEIAETLAVESWRSHHDYLVSRINQDLLSRSVSMYASNYVQIALTAMALRTKIRGEVFSDLMRPFMQCSNTEPVSIDEVLAIFENSPLYVLHAMVDDGRSNYSFSEVASQIDLPSVDSHYYFASLVRVAILALATRGVSPVRYPPEIDDILEQLCSIAQQEASATEYDDILPWIFLDG